MASAMDSQEEATHLDTWLDGIEDYIPIPAYIQLCWAINDVEPEDAVRIAHIGAFVANGKHLSPKQSAVIKEFILRLYRLRHFEQWTTKEDPVLSATYHLLQDKQTTYKEAAKFASELLNRRTNADAWRLRLSRWASDRKLPIPKVDRGRPRKKPTKDTENIG